MSTVTKPIILNETGENLVEALKQQNTILASMGAGGTGGGLKPKSYEDVQSIVRMGLAKNIFGIGDIIEVEKETTVTASLGAHTGITAVTVDEDFFVAKMNEVINGTYEFVHDGSAWTYAGNPVVISQYGLTVTGTAAKGDTIVVVESATKAKMKVMGFIEDGVSGAIALKDNTKKYGMILQSEECVYDLQYDAIEALYYCEAELPAGTYNFTVRNQVWYNDDNGKTYHFTITKAVPAGGQLVLSASYNQSLAGKTIISYASATDTNKLETSGLSLGSSGTYLGEPTGLDNMNHFHRTVLGSNNWKNSAMRQHLNSGKKAGQYWKPQTKFDRPPSWATSIAGWMHGLDPEFLAIVGGVKLQTVLNTVVDTTPEIANTGTGFDTTTDKFFLPSRTELFGDKETNSDNGVAWDYYSKNSDYATKNDGVDSNRIKYNSAGSAKYWWMRSPDAGNSYYVRCVYPTGVIDNVYASNSSGVAPACVIY